MKNSTTRTMLSDEDFLLVIEITCSDFTRAARLTGFTKEALRNHARHPRLRRPVAELQDRLAARGMLHKAPHHKGCNREDEPTVGEVAHVRAYSGYGREEVDPNPSVPLARITSLVQGLCLGEFHRLLDTATDLNLHDVYCRLLDRATETEQRLAAIKVEAELGKTSTRHRVENRRKLG